MIQVCRCLALLLFSVPLVTASAEPGTHKLYKWVDKQGQVHYGDQIPPEYSNSERKVINAQGVEVDKLDAQKSAEQAAAEDKQSREQFAQREHDRNLLSSYISVQEIERLRDQRLQLLSDQIRVTSQFLEQLDTRQRKLRSNSMQFAPYSDNPKAHAMPDQLAEELVSTANNMRTQQQNLKQKRAEQDAMSKGFATDIERFKALKGIH